MSGLGLAIGLPWLARASNCCGLQRNGSQSVLNLPGKFGRDLGLTLGRPVVDPGSALGSTLGFGIGSILCRLWVDVRSTLRRPQVVLGSNFRGRGLWIEEIISTPLGRFEVDSSSPLVDPYRSKVDARPTQGRPGVESKVAHQSYSQTRLW